MRVVIAVDNFPVPSETFIRRQIRGLEADVFARRVVAPQLRSMGTSFHVEAGFYVLRLQESFYEKGLRRLKELRERALGFQDSAWPKRARRAWDRYVRDRRPDVVLAQFGTVGVAMVPLCREAAIPLVVHFHGFDASSALRWPQYSSALPKLFEYAAAVVVVSRDMENRLEAVGCPESKIRVIPCGAPVTMFRVSMRTMKQPCRFLAVSRFIPVKGPLQTLRAFARCLERCPEVRLTMIGDGPQLGVAKEYVAEHRIGHAVAFPGWQEEARVREHMAESSAFVQHSMIDGCGAIEGWGVSLAEAAAGGLPIVATRHGGIPEQVIDGTTGFLVAEGDWSAMAEKMELLAKNPELRSAMGGAARQHILRTGNSEIQLERLRTLLKTVSGVVADGGT